MQMLAITRMPVNNIVSPNYFTLWQLSEDNVWRIKRVLSYSHMPAHKP